MATHVLAKAALSIDEAVIYLGIRRATLYRLLDSGAIKSFHIGRRRLIVQSELDSFISQRIAAEDDRGSDAGQRQEPDSE